LPAVLRHEYGHWVDDTISRMDKAKIVGQFPELDRIKADISAYGGSKYSEAFAEWFAITTDPQYDPSTFPPWVEAARKAFLEARKQ
jgi:hypothetical protein